MALEHALLVALREQPASGLELAGRFGRSIGFFWHATHQQIYKVLARMDADGWIDATAVARPASRTRRCTPCPRPESACSPTGWPSPPRWSRCAASWP
ncbi:MAG: PadR family transcriptional regulator [Nocardioides sp.]